jgi:hypothetical protein
LSLEPNSMSTWFWFFFAFGRLYSHGLTLKSYFSCFKNIHLQITKIPSLKTHKTTSLFFLLGVLVFICMTLLILIRLNINLTCRAWQASILKYYTSLWSLRIQKPYLYQSNVLKLFKNLVIIQKVAYQTNIGRDSH